MLYVKQSQTFHLQCKFILIVSFNIRPHFFWDANCARRSYSFIKTKKKTFQRSRRTFVPKFNAIPLNMQTKIIQTMILIRISKKRPDNWHVALVNTKMRSMNEIGESIILFMTSNYTDAISISVIFPDGNIRGPHISTLMTSSLFDRVSTIVAMFKSIVFCAWLMC